MWISRNEWICFHHHSLYHITCENNENEYLLLVGPEFLPGSAVSATAENGYALQEFSIKWNP
jgi:hypothetical protein